MKYKAGDKVVIGHEFTKEMDQYGYMAEYFGKMLTIRCTLRGNWYKVKEDGDKWYWKDNMIDHEATAKLKFTKGI